MRMAVEGICSRLRGLEQGHIALARWNERMHVELVDVKVVGRGVGVVEPQHHRLTDLRGDVLLVEHVVLGRKRRERGQRFGAKIGGYAMWLDGGRQNAADDQCNERE